MYIYACQCISPFFCPWQAERLASDFPTVEPGNLRWEKDLTDPAESKIWNMNAGFVATLNNFWKFGNDLILFQSPIWSSCKPKHLPVKWCFKIINYENPNGCLKGWRPNRPHVIPGSSTDKFHFLCKTMLQRLVYNLNIDFDKSKWKKWIYVRNLGI